MKTINISEASGPALDWLVAKCEGVRTYIGRYEHTMTGPCILDAELVDMGTDGPQELRYCSDWAQGGAIFEREKIDIFTEKPKQDVWVASQARYQNGLKLVGWRHHQYGPTPLIAAMRVFVASKLGSEVEIPKELT